VSFFQPSLKLRVKGRTDGRLRRTYDRALTPFRRLVASEVVDPEHAARYEGIFKALDPVRLLRQIEQLQDALWRTAAATAASEDADPPPEVPFDVGACSTPIPTPAVAMEVGSSGRRHYRTGPRVRKPLGPRTYRTRVDPFAAAWPEIESWLAEDPGRTGRAAFEELQRRHPGAYPDGQLRTLQRRVREWRTRTPLAFEDGWLAAEPLAGGPLAPVLRTVNPMPAEAAG
jgi:hypothetical protein